jgi:hypothetical protein
LTAEDANALWAEAARWPLDVSPVSDDRPFFFYQNRLRDALSLLLAGSPPHLYGNGLVVLIKVLVAALCMLLLLVALPLWLARRRDRATEGAQSSARLGADLGYVACIGLGFMFLEIGLIQRLLSYLGQPTYTLTAVLFVLLIGGGGGSRLSARLDTSGVKLALVGLIVYAGLLVLWLPSFTQSAAGLPPLGRAASAGALLLPLGALLGVPLPSALSRAATRGQERVTWLWGVNSAASVLGSILATLVSMHLGITSSLALGVALYGAALALWPKVAA